MGVEMAALERLLARNTQVATEEILAQVMVETEATRAVLFVERHGELRLSGGVSVDQACLDRAHSCWRASAHELRAGRPYWSDVWCLWPSTTDRGLVLLYLLGPGLEHERVRQTTEGASRLLGLLASESLDRVETSGARLTALDALMRHTTFEEIERRQLTMLLHESEWNISRAARARGVTRVTVYKWMRRLGIERVKTRRSLSVGRGTAITEP